MILKEKTVKVFFGWEVLEYDYTKTHPNQYPLLTRSMAAPPNYIKAHSLIKIHGYNKMKLEISLCYQQDGRIRDIDKPFYITLDNYNHTYVAQFDNYKEALELFEFACTINWYGEYKDVMLEWFKYWY